MQKLLTFFQQKISAYCVSLDVNFNESLTNDIVSFEQLGPDGSFGMCEICRPISVCTSAKSVKNTCFSSRHGLNFGGSID